MPIKPVRVVFIEKETWSWLVEFVYHVEIPRNSFNTYSNQLHQTAVFFFLRGHHCHFFSFWEIANRGSKPQRHTTSNYPNQYGVPGIMPSYLGVKV